MLVVLIPGVGIKVDGARRWLGYGAFRIQPSEMAKLGVADVHRRRACAGGSCVIGDWRRTVRPIVIVLGITGVLMMGEPDLASLMVIVAMVFSMLVAGGVRARHLDALTGSRASVSSRSSRSRCRGGERGCSRSSTRSNRLATRATK